MTLYETRQYLRYRWKAKGRHGTHSPFVYAFVEDLLQPSGNDDGLLKNMLSYFGFKIVSEYAMTPTGESSAAYTLTDNAYGHSTFQKRASLPFNQLYSLTAHPPLDKPLLDKLLTNIQPDDVLLIKLIHHTQQHTEQWNRLKADERVRLSMDLFSMGLLFFKKEFKVKQDFVLKY